MKSIAKNLRCYFFEINKGILIAVSSFTAILVFINYHFGLDNFIRKNNTDLIKLLAWYAVFLLSFSIPYFITGFFKSVTYLKRPAFLFLLLIAPLVFAIKLSFGFTFFITKDPYLNSYWNHIIEWPLLLLIIASIVFLIWKFFDKDQPLYGLSSKNLDWKPYLLMILIMIPLIAAASTQADFLSMYPKLHTIAGVDNENEITWWHKLLFELSYGSDFISIELFFRGFLILALVKAAGSLVWGGINVLEVTYAGQVFPLSDSIFRQVFHIENGGTAALGMIYIVSGLGTGLGPLVMRRWLGDRRQRMLLGISLGFGLLVVGIVILVWSGTLPVYLTGTLVRTVGTGTVWVFSAALLQIMTPDRFRGRVFAFEFAALTLTQSVSTFFAGYAQDSLGMGVRQVTAVFAWLGVVERLAS